jgi:hypothetical protein
MVNLTWVTYLLIELLTDTALSHVLFVVHVPTGKNSAKQIKKGVHRNEVKVSDQYYGY